MTVGPIGPKLARLAWPLVLGNLLQTVYNLADIFWVGRVSAEAVAAVALMFPLSWMFVSTAMGVTAATIALVSQSVGAGDDRHADHVVAQSTLLTLAIGAVLAALGLTFRHELLSLIGARGVVFVEALAYIEVIFLTLPLTFLFFAFRASLQGAGDTKTAMWLMVVSAGLNVVLDPFLILGWGPFPAWGTRGAAVATLLARGVATLGGIYVLLRGGFGVRLRPADLRPEPAILRQLVHIGYPASLDGWARSFSSVVMAGFVARFGPAPTAAYGIGLRFMSVTWTVAGAVGQATATGVGQNLGAGDADRAIAVTRVATATTMALLFGVAGLVVAFPAAAMRVFIADPAVIEEGVGFFRIVAPSWAFFGGVMVVQGAFRGAGRTRIALALSLLSRWLLRVPIALVLAFAWTVTLPLPVPGLGDGVVVVLQGAGVGVAGVWWSFAIGAVGSFLVAVALFLRAEWSSMELERPARRPPGPAGDVGGVGDVEDGSLGPDRP